MISCNHFAITTTCLQGFLQIYCKNAFFTENLLQLRALKLSVGRAKTLSECLLAHFSCEVHTTKKVSENSETFILGAENESLSICSPLCISSNCLCPVLYSQFEGHLGGFRVSFSSPTFAIQTSELQLLTTNLRIIFELTKSKRDGLYL